MAEYILEERDLYKQLGINNGLINGSIRIGKEA